jgi:hypothetical protein
MFRNKQAQQRYEQERFQREHPKKQMRGLVINEVMKAIEFPLKEFEAPLKLHNYVQINLPFSSYLSKNQYGFSRFRGGHFTLQETKDLQGQIAWLIKMQHPVIHKGKVWVDIFVEKPTRSGDAVNYVDRICDAIQTAIGTNDNWYSLRRVDWRVVKRNPQIYIGIGQAEQEPMSTCSACGRYLPVDPYFNKPKAGVDTLYQNCRSCRSRKTDEIAL